MDPRLYSLILGILFQVSPHPVYSSYTQQSKPWPLTGTNSFEQCVCLQGGTEGERKPLLEKAPSEGERRADLLFPGVCAHFTGAVANEESVNAAALLGLLRLLDR